MGRTNVQSPVVAQISPTIAVLVPCLNEEIAIAKVVRDFRACLPGAAVYVYDNNSTDGTVAAAQAAGALVGAEPIRGKGNVVRRMFADVEADVYVLVDGDDTYDASAAPHMVELLLRSRLDMVNGVRVTDIESAYRPGHRLGNLLLTSMVRGIFGRRITDILSGYRVFSRRFVKSFPATSSGFETETEFAVHALELRMPVGEMETRYKDRPPGSTSKLRTFSDGFRILRTIVILLKEERPFQFFSAIGGALMLAGVLLSVPVFIEFFHTGLVPRLPTAVLSVGMVLLSFLFAFVGLILDSVAKGRREIKRLAYLGLRGASAGEGFSLGKVRRTGSASGPWRPSIGR